MKVNDDGSFEYTIDELIQLDIPLAKQIIMFGGRLEEIKNFKDTITTWCKIEDMLK